MSRRRPTGPPAVPAVRRPLAACAGALALAALVAPTVALTRPPVHAEPVPGLEVWRSGGAAVVVVAPGTGAIDTLEGLRRAGATRADVLVVGPGSGAGEEERAARHRVTPGRIIWLGRDRPRTTRVGDLLVVATAEAVCVAPAPMGPCTPPPEGSAPG